MILIIGTGRSGTHWLARIIQQHPGCAGLIEVDPIFTYATQMGLNHSLRDEMMPKLIAAYKDEITKVTPKRFFDKSHPNIWQAEALLAAFPDVQFIGTNRSVQGTVASMLRHGGVQDWIFRWKEYPVPNPFLGITENNQHRYSSLSLAEQCALRWKSHDTRMKGLKETLGDKLYIIGYEALQDNPEQELQKLQQFLRLDTAFTVPEIKRDSRDQWQTQLSAAEIEAVERIAATPIL